MRKYRVTLLSQGAYKGYDAHISADYILYPNGMLVFKNEKRGSYPEVIRIFAPGAWNSVELVEEEVTAVE